MTLKVGSLWGIIGVETFLEGEVLHVDIDGQKIKYLSKQQYFDYIREEDGDYGGD